MYVSLPRIRVRSVEPIVPGNWCFKAGSIAFSVFRSCRAPEFCLSWLPLMMKIWIGGYVYLEASRTSVGVCFVFVQNFKFREIKNCGVLKNTELFSAGCEVSSFL